MDCTFLPMSPSRHRDKKKFEIIVQSIKNLGLKKPIQVSVRSTDEAEGPGYDLVCGQGRIEAFTALGYKEIPAIVVEISKEDRLAIFLHELLSTKALASIQPNSKDAMQHWTNCESNVAIFW